MTQTDTKIQTLSKHNGKPILMKSVAFGHLFPVTTHEVYPSPVLLKNLHINNA